MLCKEKFLSKILETFLYYTYDLSSVEDVDYRCIEKMYYTHNNRDIICGYKVIIDSNFVRV